MNRSKVESTTAQARPKIEVEVETAFIPEQSHPEQQHFFFSYNIHISNRGELSAQLLERHWIITDGWGRTNEVRGAGVVGKQPWILPRETFEYSSFCPLPTSSGTMKGTYLFRLESGEEFLVEIPPFFLIESELMH